MLRLTASPDFHSKVLLECQDVRGVRGLGCFLARASAVLCSVLTLPRPLLALRLPNHHHWVRLPQAQRRAGRHGGRIGLGDHFLFCQRIIAGHHVLRHSAHRFYSHGHVLGVWSKCRERLCSLSCGILGFRSEAFHHPQLKQPPMSVILPQIIAAVPCPRSSCHLSKALGKRYYASEAERNANTAEGDGPDSVGLGHATMPQSMGPGTRARGRRLELIAKADSLSAWVQVELQSGERCGGSALPAQLSPQAGLTCAFSASATITGVLTVGELSVSFGAREPQVRLPAPKRRSFAALTPT